MPVVVEQDGGADLECEGQRRGRVRLLDQLLLQRREADVLGDVADDVRVEERPPGGQFNLNRLINRIFPMVFL